MIEYLHNAIRATAGSDITVTAIVADNDTPITENCHIMLFDRDSVLLETLDGSYDAENGVWYFTIPGELTKEKRGRHWYRICTPVESLCFKQPLYLVD